MKAAVFDRFGEPTEVLTCREAPTPEPGPGQVRVRMLASPINVSDLLTIRGQYAKLPRLPAIPGYEGVGVVDAAGKGLLGTFLRGKRVAVLSGEGGAWGEFAVVAARQVVPLPRSISDEQGAMFFVNPATAYVMTRLVLKVPQGEWLLQTAASSALGRLVVKLGKRCGFRTLSVVRRADAVAPLMALGADEVIVAGPEDIETKVRAIAKNGVRFAIDPVGGALGSAVVRCLARGGSMIVFGTLAAEPLSFSPRDLMAPSATIHGFWLGNWFLRASLVQKLRLVSKLARLIREGTLASEVSETFSLEQAAQAAAASEQSGRNGKVILRVG